MAQVVLDKSEDPEVTDLASRIQAAQGPEIELMTGWLSSWGEPVPGRGGDHESMGEPGEGMLTDDEMAALDAAEPPELERLFLEGMITHHEGAIAMAETEIAEGMSPDAKALAQDIIEAQKAEIGEMKSLLRSR